MNELKRDWHGRVLPREVKILPNKDWGYFIGLVLGDGFIRKNQTRTCSVCLGSTKKEIVEIFFRVATGLGLHCFFGNRPCNLTLPDGQKREVTVYEAIIHSKQLYDFFCPLKGEDYHFEVPPLVFETQDTLRGFLQGFFDAEGTIYLQPHRVVIRLVSKYASNLVQIQNCLDSLGIGSHINNHKEKSSLTIADYDSRIRFRDLIGFRLQAKQHRLQVMPNLQRQRYSREDYLKALGLRKEGYTYNQIQRELGNASKGVISGWLGRGRIAEQIKVEDYYAKKRKAYLGA